MRKLKKALCLMLTSCMVLGNVSVAMAEDTVVSDDGGQASTLISAEITGGFTVKIPKTVELTATGSGYGQSVSGSIPVIVEGSLGLAEGISITPDSSVYKLTDEDTGVSINTALTASADTVINGVSLAKSNGIVNTAFKVASIDAAIAAGSYKANVIFDVNLVDLSHLTVYSDSVYETIADDPAMYAYFEDSALVGNLAAIMTNGNVATAYVVASSANPTTTLNVPYGACLLYERNGLNDVDTVILPESLHTIQGTALNNLTNLTSITIPTYCSLISTGSFAGCSALETVVINSEVVSISSAFTGLTALNTVTFNGDALILLDNAFNGCTALTKLTLPADITAIRVEGSPFNGCTAFATVEYNGTEYTNNDELVEALKANGCYVFGTILSN